MGVWIDALAPDKQRVNVVVVSLNSGDMGGPNERGVQHDIATALSILQRGETPPTKRP